MVRLNTSVVSVFTPVHAGRYGMAEINHNHAAKIPEQCVGCKH